MNEYDPNQAAPDSSETEPKDTNDKPYRQSPPPENHSGGMHPVGFQSINRTPDKKRPPADNLAVSSVAAGIGAIVTSCCGFPTGVMIGFAMGMLGLVLGIVSKKGQPFSGFAIAGMILSVMGILCSLLVFFSYMFTSYMMTDPTYGPMMRDMMEQYKSQLGIQ